MDPVIVLHHHEIVLKGENRLFFERHLMSNVRGVLADLPGRPSVRGGYGRFIVRGVGVDALEPAVERLSRVFGLSNICPGLETTQDVGAFCETAADLLEGRDFKTIRVDARRPDKNFPVGSMEVNARVGEFLCRRFNVHANLTSPDETIYVEVVSGTAFVYRSKLPGAGGLPTGVTGKVIALLSAGFDSPVASWQIMRRGATVSFAHFHSMPYTGPQSVEQVRRIAKALTKYQFRSKLYLVPFAEVQNEIVASAPQRLRVILYRRLMVRIAEEIARTESAEALVTGESLGQVASQTLRNIRVIDAAASLPILRPLSGTDKEETMAIARKVGTYEISSEPYDDCCSFLAPRQPETWADPAEVAAAESNLDIPRLVRMATEPIAVEQFSFPAVPQEALAV